MSRQKIKHAPEMGKDETEVPSPIEFEVTFAVNIREGATFCGISMLSDGGKRIPEYTSFGVAFCSDSDEFSRLRGKRESFKMALQSLGFSKEEITSSWEEWVKRHVKQPEPEANFQFDRALSKIRLAEGLAG